eukprot:523753-Hanusia_phi.AAC.1
MIARSRMHWLDPKRPSSGPGLEWMLYSTPSGPALRALPQCPADSVTGPALSSKGPCRSAPLSE